MNFISEIFEFGSLQIQPTARGSEGASIGFGSHFQLLVAGKKNKDLLRENLSDPLGDYSMQLNMRSYKWIWKNQKIILLSSESKNPVLNSPPPPFNLY